MPFPRSLRPSRSGKVQSHSFRLYVAANGLLCVSDRCPSGYIPAVPIQQPGMTEREAYSLYTLVGELGDVAPRYYYAREVARGHGGLSNLEEFMARVVRAHNHIGLAGKCECLRRQFSLAGPTLPVT